MKMAMEKLARQGRVIKKRNSSEPLADFTGKNGGYTKSAYEKNGEQNPYL